MNRRQRLAQFVDQNLGLLTSPRTDKLAIKHLRQAFFEKHNLRSADRFSASDVAAEVVRKVTQAKASDGAETIVDACLSIPFVAEAVPANEIRILIQNSMPTSDSVLSPADLRKLTNQEHLARIEQEFEARAKAEADDILALERERLREKEADVQGHLNRLKSAVSALDGEAPSIDLEEEAENSPLAPAPATRPWWDDLGLEADPFPTDRGLVGIPKEKYDDIFVETDFSKRYLRMVDDPAHFLGKTIILAGEFGTGKTTLFEVCQRRLGVTGVLPIRAIMNPSANVGGLMVDFLSQLGDGLCEALVQSGGIDPRREIGTIDTLRDLGRVADAARQAGVSQRLVIFVDGLHKGHKYVDETFEFLQQLQNTQEFLEGRAYSLGTIVAGSGDWGKRFEATPSLSGSIHHIDTIPPISEDEAVEAAVRRILAFSRRASPAPLRKEPLRLAYRALAGRTAHVTFRAFLNHIHNRLSARQFNEVGLSVEVHLETVDEVRRSIMSSGLRDGYLRLLKETEGKPRARRAIPRLITAIYAQKGLVEGSGTFRQHLRTLHLLAAAGFIEKGLANEQIVWRISRSLGKFLEALYKQNQILPLDALSALTIEKGEAVRQEVHRIYEGGVVAFKDVEELSRNSWPELAELSKDVQQNLAMIEDAIQRKGPCHVDITLVTRSTRTAMAGMAWAASGAPHMPSHEAIQDSWAAPENVDEFDRISGLDSMPDKETEAFGLFHAHAGLMAEAGQMVAELAKGESLARIARRNLTTEDQRAVHGARLEFAKSDFRSAIAACYDYLEAKIRRIVFVRLYLAVGSQVKKLLPPDVSSNLPTAPRGHPRAKRAPDANFLYDISRSEYAKILFSGKILKVLGMESRPAIEIQRLRDAVELTFSLGDRKAHGDRAEFFREHATEIGDCIKAMPRLCELLNERLAETFTDAFISIEKASNAVVFSVASLPGDTKSAKHELSSHQIEKLVRAALERLDQRTYSLDVLVGYVSVPGVTSHEVLPVLTTMRQQDLVSLEANGTRIAITPAGERRLARLRRSPQTTLEATIEPS